VGELLKRAMKGEIDLLAPAKAVGAELMGIPDFGSVTTDYFEIKKKMLVNFKKSILMVAGAAIQKYMDKFADEQEIMIALADMIILTYAAESSLLRTEKLSKILSEDKLVLYKDMTDVFFYDVAGKINKSGVDVVNAFATGDEQQAMLMGMKRFTKASNLNSIAARRRIADYMIEKNQYPF